MGTSPMSSTRKQAQATKDSVTAGAGADPAALVMAARQLLDEGGSAALHREWQRLFTRINEPHFSVVVVGEHSRGKSTLINRLLGADVLPVGPLPTTTLLTRVCYAPEPSLVGLRPEGGREPIAAAPEGWQRLLAGAQEPRWATLECGVPNDWLRATGIHLFDTPGAGDLESRRIEEVIDAISVSDATLIAIDARMALSLTERAFIEQHVLGRRVPHIVGVVTHLDEVQEADRAAVLRHVHDRLAAIHHQIVFACAHDGPLLPAEVAVEVAGPAAIAGVLSTWAAAPEHGGRVRRQLLANLRRFLTLSAADLATRRAAAAMAVDERHRALEDERFRFDHARLGWEDLRLGLRQRGEATVEWLEQHLAAQEQALSEKLGHALAGAADPGHWWRQDLPFQLRQELATLAATTGRPLERRVLADVRWLSREVDSRFGRPLETPEIEPFIALAGEPPAVAAIGQAHDLLRLRLIARVGAGAATLIGYWLYGPLGMAASVGAGLAGEFLIKRHEDDRRSALRRALGPIVQRCLRQATVTGRRRIEEAYEAAFAETRRQEEVWSTTQREALELAGQEEQGGERLAASLELLATLESQTKDEAVEEDIDDRSTDRNPANE
jgi:Dynamin family